MRYKWISQAFIANWANLKLYPRFWLNKAIETPNFKHWSFTNGLAGGTLGYKERRSNGKS